MAPLAEATLLPPPPTSLLKAFLILPKRPGVFGEEDVFPGPLLPFPLFTRDVDGPLAGPLVDGVDGPPVAPLAEATPDPRTLPFPFPFLGTPVAPFAGGVDGPLAGPLAGGVDGLPAAILTGATLPLPLTNPPKSLPKGPVLLFREEAVFPDPPAGKTLPLPNDTPFPFIRF